MVVGGSDDDGVGRGGDFGGGVCHELTAVYSVTTRWAAGDCPVEH